NSLSLLSHAVHVILLRPRCPAASPLSPYTTLFRSMIRRFRQPSQIRGTSMIKRRNFVGGLALAAGAAACGRSGPTGGESAGRDDRTFEWNMVTSWPPGLPGAGSGAEKLARRIEVASNGRLRIRVFAGGELVPALEVFDAV